MLPCLVKNIAPKRYPRQAKAAETAGKKAVQQLAEDLARADDDGFALQSKN